VAAYARVSTDEIDQLNSYQTQIREFTHQIEHNPDWEFAGMFADEGISGTDMTKRPGFIQMLEAARAGLIDMMITKSISRFARNTIDCLSVIKEMRALGVEIFFEKENLITSDPKTDFFLTVLSSIAQEESRSISENTKWGLQKRFKQGKVFMNTTTFLGYDKNEKGDLIINEEQAETVRMIFDLYISGYTISEISRTLKANNVLNGRHRVAWFPDTVKDILRNEKYVGDAILQKTITVDYLKHQSVKNDGITTKYYISNNHQPIIERPMFDMVQTMIQARDTILATDNKERLKHLSRKPLKGLVYCGICGAIYHSKMNNSGTVYRKSVLKCHTSVQNPHNCVNKSINQHLLERTAVYLINLMNTGNDKQESVLAAIDKKLQDSLLTEEIKSNKMNRSQIGEQMRKLVQQKVSLRIDQATYQQEYQRLEKSLNSINKNLDGLKLDLTQEHLMRKRMMEIKTFLENHEPDPSIIKGFFGLILMMGPNRVRFVIDNTFSTMDDLFLRFDKIKQLCPTLSGTYLDMETKINIYYEVITYE
jgi:DNA invertase Pin-like site-specific DNA recombinase